MSAYTTIEKFIRRLTNKVNGGQTFQLFERMKLARKLRTNVRVMPPAAAASVAHVRLVLKTTDGAVIGMTYRGLRHGASDVLRRIDRGERIDPASYYFRINPMFETASPKYDWLNRILCIGVGDRHADGPVYSVFEIL